MLNLNPNTKQEPHIVIVNDDRDTFALFLSCFQHLNWHHQVKILDDADALFVLLYTIPDPELLPTLIVLDYKTIYWNEDAVLMLLKEDPRYQHIPVAIYAASVSEKMKKRLQTLGVHFCRKKPTTMSSMHRQVEELIELANPHHIIQHKAII